MQTDQANGASRLEAGQLWKLEDGYVYIVELGRRHVYYRMLRQPDQKTALTRMIGVEAMLRYLHQSEAALAGIECLSGQPASNPQSSAVDLASGEASNLGRDHEAARNPLRVVEGPAVQTQAPGPHSEVATAISRLLTTGPKQLRTFLGHPECAG